MKNHPEANEAKKTKAKTTGIEIAVFNYNEPGKFLKSKYWTSTVQPENDRGRLFLVEETDNTKEARKIAIEMAIDEDKMAPSYSKYKTANLKKTSKQPKHPFRDKAIMVLISRGYTELLYTDLFDPEPIEIPTNQQLPGEKS